MLLLTDTEKAKAVYPVWGIPPAALLLVGKGATSAEEVVEPWGRGRRCHEHALEEPLGSIGQWERQHGMLCGPLEPLDVDLVLKLVPGEFVVLGAVQRTLFEEHCVHGVGLGAFDRADGRHG